MIFTLTNLSTGIDDYDSEFVLDADENKYLFNVRDGCQRVCSEHAIRLSRIKCIFISRISPQTLGGLPGMLLSVYDMGLRQVTIYGPEGLGKYIASLQLFIFRKDYQITVVELEDDIPSIDLNNGCFICPFVVKEHEIDNQYERKEIHSSEYVDLHLSLVHRKEPYYHSEISYLINIPKISGKFCLDKAKALGIPKGPFYRELANGHSITFNNQIITSDQVMSETSQGPSVLLLNIHSSLILTHLQLLLQTTILPSYQSTLLAIYQNHPPSFSLSFPSSLPSSIHFFSLPYPYYHPLIHTASTFVCNRLHSLFPSLFPSLLYSPSFPSSSSSSFLMIPRSVMKVAPLKGQGEVTLPSIINDLPAIRPEEEIISKTYASYLDQGTSSGLKGKLTFLGTGSAVPSKYRNVCSILYRVSSSLSMLLDCGEGTYNQLIRLFPQSIESILNSIKIIVISHSHADHHLGLPLLLNCIANYHPKQGENENCEKRRKVDETPILIFAPRRVKVFLDLYSSFIPCIKQVYTFVEIHFPTIPLCFPIADKTPLCITELQKLTDLPLPEKVEKTITDSGVIELFLSQFNIKLSFFHMIHCDDSSAVLIQSQGATILYTGDGRPAYHFTDLFPKDTNVDILINESTFTKDRQAHAEQKNHCTMEEALDVAKHIHAKYTILTHFSQRYPKNLTHDQGMKGKEQKSLENRVGDNESFFCVHDLMEVDLSQIHNICKIGINLETCFIDEDDE